MRSVTCKRLKPRHLPAPPPADIFKEDFRSFEREGRLPYRWSTGNTVAIEAGARFLLLKQGGEGRGVFGSGVTISAGFSELHWDTDRAAAGEMANRVMVLFDRLLPPDADNLTEVANAARDPDAHSTCIRPGSLR